MLPGNYTIAAYGFDATKPEGNAGRPPYDQAPSPWTVSDGGELIRFEGLSRFGRHGAGQYPGHLDKGPANRYAAGTFIFSAATLPDPPHAADYAALTAGVTGFPLEDMRHLGSIAVINPGAFPVLVEMGGNRNVIEAAGTYNDDPNGARAVGFSHFQWEQPLLMHVPDDTRLTLFENAIKWTSRKSNPANIVVGVTTNLDLYFMHHLDISPLVNAGFQVVPIDFPTLDPTNGLPPMDVLVLDGHARYDENWVGQIKKFTAGGGGLVMSMTPRYVIYTKIQPAFDYANEILQPFGLAYRAILAIPADFGFTNVQAIAYPSYFTALPAAQLLHQDRVGQTSLGAQEKAIALNTINYAVYGRPDLLASLTAMYATGTTNSIGGQPTDASPDTPVGASMGSLIDAVTLTGAQASTNRLGRWVVDGNDLVAKDRRGVVEYQFNLAAADVYRLQIEGTQSLTNSLRNDFDLVLSVDGVDLGHHILTAGYGTNATVECWTPYLLAGPHTLRVLLDGAASSTALQINAVRVQTALGQDSDGNGIKDWVDQFVRAKSGLDLTNEVISSYVSPVCLEGRDPFPSLMAMYIGGADDKTPSLRPHPAPNERWYVNVPLSAYVDAQTIFHVSAKMGR